MSFRDLVDVIICLCLFHIASCELNVGIRTFFFVR